MAIKLYFGERSKFEHESEQILEIVKLIAENFPEDDICILTNVLFSNGDIDCIILTKDGPIILELKNYSGEVIGTENGDWFVMNNGEDIPLNSNLYSQLKLKRNDFHKKFEKIRERYFPRIELEDLRKISAWGYFKEGSTYPNDQMNLNQMPWFSVVTKSNIVKKIRLHHTGYSFTVDDMEHIIQENNVQ